jgi:hypothetical protein
MTVPFLNKHAESDLFVPETDEDDGDGDDMPAQDKLQILLPHPGSSPVSLHHTGAYFPAGTSPALRL